MLTRLRNKLSPKDVALFKLVVWVAMLTWLVFFTIFGIVGTIVLAGKASEVYDGRWYEAVMQFLLPAWFIFTVLLIDILMMRYTNRKLRGVKDEDSSPDQQTD